MYIFILGTSGWIGGEIASSLSSHAMTPSVTGSFCSHLIQEQGFKSVHLDSRDADSLVVCKKTLRPDIIVNALDWKISPTFFDECLDWAHRSHALFVHISSSCVFDGKGDQPHAENDAPCAASEYGMAKMRHERMIEESGIEHAIIRFSAPHGFAKNRITRTEIFLKRLQQGEIVEVDRGVVQNRLASKELGRQIAEIVIRRASGIFHLGTMDSSEEIDFLRRLATAFGYSSEQLVARDSIVSRNVVTIPHNICQLLGETACKTERETIETVASERGIHSLVSQNPKE